MKKSEKEAKEKLARVRDPYGDGYLTDRRGGGHEGVHSEGTIKDGLLRRLTKQPPKRAK